MKIFKTIIVLIIIIGVFWLGFHIGKLHMFPGKQVPSESISVQPSGLQQIKEWTCSMHPQIRQPKPGKCPICGMDLIPVKNTMYNESAGTAELKLSPEAEKLAEIETAPVERKFVPVKIRMAGKIGFNEETMAYITARMAGRVDKLFVNYTGIAVKKEDHVAEIFSPDLMVAQREVLETLDLIKKSKSDNKFAKEMMSSVREKYRLWGFSDKQVDEIIKKGKVSDHLTITAPISGIVTEKDVNEGQYFEKGERLFTIADLNMVWGNLEAYETDLPWIRYGQEIEFTTEAYPGKTFKGRIAFIRPFMNEMTRTIGLRLNVDNHDGMLKPGMFISAILSAKITDNGKLVDTSLAGKWISPMHPEIIKDAPGVCDICGIPLVPAESLGYVDKNDKSLSPPLVIPASAPLITGKRAVVYVSVPDRKGVYEGREISLGPRAGDYYIVKAGLKEGENVVVRGNFKIDSALQILAKPSMMAPASENTGRQDTGTPPNKQSPLSTDEKQEQKEHPVLSDDILDSYFAVWKALFQDDLGETIKQAGKLDERYSSKLASSKDIKSAREDFAVISSYLYRELSGNSGKIKRTVYKFFCPMAFDGKGAIWLQDNDKTQNPYFGSVMPNCGELQETIAGEK